MLWQCAVYSFFRYMLTPWELAIRFGYTKCPVLWQCAVYSFIWVHAYALCMLQQCAVYSFIWVHTYTLCFGNVLFVPSFRCTHTLCDLERPFVFVVSSLRFSQSGLLLFLFYFSMRQLCLVYVWLGQTSASENTCTANIKRVLYLCLTYRRSHFWICNKCEQLLAHTLKK